MANDRSRQFLFVLLLIASVLLALVISSFAASLFAAAVLASALYPVQERWTRRLNNRRYLAAGLLTASIVLSVVVPIVIASGFVVREGQRAVHWLNETISERGIDGLIEPLPDALESTAKRALDMLPAGVIEDARRPDAAPPQGQAPSEKESAKSPSHSDSGPNVTSAASAVAAGLSRIGRVLIGLGVCILAIFFLLAEGADLVKYIIGVAPLDPKRSRELLVSFREVSVGVLISALATSAAQTLVASIGYVIAGVPSLPLVVLATALFSFLPTIGGSGVAVCAGALVWMSGRPGMGLFLIIWGVLAVGLIDNVVKPWVAKGRVHLPGSVVFFAMICGLAVFGPLGLVGGPMVVVFFQIVARMLHDERQRPATAKTKSET